MSYHKLFPDQQENEEVLCFIRKHQVVYIKIIAAFLLVVIFPMAAFTFAWFQFLPYSENNSTTLVMGILVSLFVLYGLLFAMIRWLNEEFDVFIITSDRLIDHTHVTFLKRSVATTPLAQIQDTTGNVHGFFPTLLNYGDLRVQTASGAASEFFIDRIPDPENVARQILNWANEKRHKGGTIRKEERPS
ncbi:PH domain-containing protein [Candidatus Peregrinibacteria bacterium]|nr:MAG: PH domain-containing protein [Candidatus Peregrinibacteria bacterium]